MLHHATTKQKLYDATEMHKVMQTGCCISRQGDQATSGAANRSQDYPFIGESPGVSQGALRPYRARHVYTLINSFKRFGNKL